MPGRRTNGLEQGKGLLRMQQVRVGVIWPTAHAVGAGGSYLDNFLSSFISLFFLPLSGRRPDID